jgi:pimeloyl-ACP methyl ester carboxylesterase
MVAIGGVSLGGGVAIRCAVNDRRLLGAMAVTPPYDPASWWDYVNPLVRMQLVTLGVSDKAPEDVVADFDLTTLVTRLQLPLLVFGAGRDLVVPPEESIALAAAAGDLATFVWYPSGGHCLYHEMPDWLDLTAKWVNGLAGKDEIEQAPPVMASYADEGAAPIPAPLPVDDHLLLDAGKGAWESTQVDSIEDVPEPIDYPEPVPAATFQRHDPAGPDPLDDDDDDLWR